MSLPHVPWVSLQCVIVVFPDHTHFLVILSNDTHCNVAYWWQILNVFTPKTRSMYLWQSCDLTNPNEFKRTYSYNPIGKLLFTEIVLLISNRLVKFRHCWTLIQVLRRSMQCRLTRSDIIYRQYMVKVEVMNCIDRLWQTQTLCKWRKKLVATTGSTKKYNNRTHCTSINHTLAKCSNHSKSRLLFSSAELFKKPLWQTVWTQIRLLL